MRGAWRKLVDNIPVVVIRRSELFLREFNACELGRDYERGVQTGKIPQ